MSLDDFGRLSELHHDVKFDGYAGGSLLSLKCSILRKILLVELPTRYEQSHHWVSCPSTLWLECFALS